jgi:PAS domain S-box-containing protein
VKFSRQYTIPTILFLGVMLLGWMGIQYSQRQESQKLDIKTQIVAEQVGIRLHEFINTRLSRLDYFRAYVEGEPDISEAAFRSRALLIQNELSGFQAINYIDVNGFIQWVTPLSPNLPVLGINLVEKAAEGAAQSYNRARIYRLDSSTPLIDLVQGGQGFATYLPIIQNGEITGMINGVFRTEELVDQCLGRTVRDYNYKVIFSGQPIFQRGEASNFESPEAVGRYNFNILGQSWELQIVPGSSEVGTPIRMIIAMLITTLIIATLVALYTFSKMKSQAQIRSAYEIIEKSETKFRTIFDKSPAGLVRFNEKGVLTDWNQAAATLFQFEFPARQDRDLHAVEGMENLMIHLNRSLQGQPCELRGHIHIGDRRREVEAAFEPIISTGDQFDGGVILIKDVTEENQTLHAKTVMYEIDELTKGEKDLPKLYESIQKSLSRVLDTRNFYIALFDAEAEEFHFPFFRDEFDSPPPPAAKHSKSLSAYVMDQKVPISLSKEQIYSLHDKGEIELRGTPAEQYLGAPLMVDNLSIGLMAIQSYSKDVIYDENDLNILRFVSGQIATTIQFHLEDEKLRLSEIKHRELSQQLIESNNIKALLLDIITHDLKNPAGVISSVSDMLISDNDATDEIRLIKDSSDALLKVISDTTALAKITLGERVSVEKLDLSQLLSDVIREYKSLFEMAGKPLQLEVAPDIQHEANAVIAEVYRNYLSNALKYAPDKEAVQVCLFETSDEIIFEVKDLGKTILGKDQQLIFERSIQLSNGISRGSGLGLAIVKRIALVHQARVGVKPNEPQGNIFYMKIKKNPHIDEA